MSPEPSHQDALVRYLLGQSAPEERAAIERQYLADPAYLEELEIAEGDLIERYLDGQLGAEQLAAFRERYLASPEGRRKVEMQNAIIQSFAKHRKAAFLWSAPVWLRGVMAALGVVIVLVAGWYLGQRWITPRVVSVFLTPGTRDAMTHLNEVTIPPKVALVRMQCRVKVNTEAGPLKAVFKNPDDKELFSSSAHVIQETRDGDALVEIDYPARALPAGDYIIQIGSAASRSVREPAAAFAIRVRVPSAGK